MLDVIIRPALVSEQKALEALQLHASLSNAGDRDALLAHPDAIELPIDQIASGRVFIAERDGTILGFATAIPREDGDTELDGLFVEPHSWAQGLGRLLVEHCVEVARAHGSAALHVVGNPHAKGFYLACGFELTGTVQTRFGAAPSLRKIICGSVH
jgi:GNAT superfamily N-acetyltransferase